MSVVRRFLIVSSNSFGHHVLRAPPHQSKGRCVNIACEPASWGAGGSGAKRRPPARSAVNEAHSAEKGSLHGCHGILNVRVQNLDAQRREVLIGGYF